MENRTTVGSPLYLLERSDVGLVQLDRELRVVAMNSFARRVLPVEDKQPFDKIVLSFHPERSQSKVKFLLDQAECPVSNAPPMTMIIDIPERVLLIKVTKMSDMRDETTGFPTIAQNRIVLVDAASVSYVRAEGHYTWVHGAGIELLQPQYRRPRRLAAGRVFPAHPPQLSRQPRLRRADLARRRQGHAQAAQRRVAPAGGTHQRAEIARAARDRRHGSRALSVDTSSVARRRVSCTRNAVRAASGAVREAPGRRPARRINVLSVRITNRGRRAPAKETQR